MKRFEGKFIRDVMFFVNSFLLVFCQHFVSSTFCITCISSLLDRFMIRSEEKVDWKILLVFLKRFDKMLSVLHLYPYNNFATIR